MTARADFDVGPLSWVKGEIDHAIQRSQEALRAFATNSADAVQLKSSQSHLHQAHGALSIVGLEGITRVSEELEGLLAGIEKEASLRKSEIFQLAERALNGIRTYLDQLMTGSPNQPLRLYALYRDVVTARGGRADPTDLYYPNLTFRPPKRDKLAGALRAGDSDKYLREQRGRYQRGLLKWLKNDTSGAEDMLAAIDYCIYPNMVGPLNAGNWILFRFRPNGKDPDTCLYDVMFLHRFGDDEDVPAVEHEFYAKWEDHDGWGPTIGQDLSNMGHVQAGLHQTSFTGLRLNRQEAGVRNFEKFIDRHVLADGDLTA